MIDTAPICPNCGKTESDCTNGGDPGPWWHNEYIPEGDCAIDCENCGKPTLFRLIGRRVRQE
jgi:hypothetical protein